MSTRAVKRRRPHTKSRSGCTQCRGRRVKCDEVRPTCSNCRDKDKACDYSRPMRSPGLHNFAVTENNIASRFSTQASYMHKASHPLHPERWQSAIPPHPKQGDETHYLHIWSTKTCYSFTSTHVPFLRDRVGAQALSCDFLMGALLASTSLHLANDAKDVTTAQRLIKTSLEHQNRAIAGLNPNLQTLSPQNCDDVFLTTILMMMCAFISSIMPVAHAKSSTDMLIDAFNLLNGVQTVGICCFPWLFQGRAEELFGTGDKVSRKKGQLDATVAIESLRTLNHNHSSGDNRELLASLISKLAQGFYGDIDEVPWLMSAGPTYIDLLRRNDLIANVLLMHYGVLLARIEGLWWARLAGVKIVNEISQLLEGLPDEIAKMAVWCRKNIRIKDLARSDSR